MNASPHAAGSSRPASSVEVREQLVEALRLDLVGPWAGHPLETERLPNYARYVRPSNWYLTGFLVPPDITVPAGAEAEASDDLDETPADAGTTEEASDDGRPARRGYFPSSMGLSFLIDGDTSELAVTVRWGDYAPEGIDEKLVWSRIPREESTVARVPGTRKPKDWEIPRSNGLLLRTVARSIQSGTLGRDDQGVRSVSIFLVNRRKQDPDEPVVEDRLYVFQPEIEGRSERPFHSSRWRGQPGPPTGTTMLQSSITRTHPNTRQVTGSRLTGIPWTAHAASSTPPGSARRRSKSPPLPP